MHQNQFFHFSIHLRCRFKRVGAKRFRAREQFKAEAAPKTEHAPMAALCHALLNSSEFLYVE